MVAARHTRLLPPGLEARELIRRLDGGMTRPFLCRASDNRQYVLKGADLPPRERIAELLAAHLASAFGLPVPEFGCIWVDPMLLRYEPEARTDLGEGDCFATLYVPQCMDLMFGHFDQASPALQRDIYVFDRWIRNADRQCGPLGGRSNLLYCPAAEQKIWVIDHNQAFENDFQHAAFAGNHTFGPGHRNWAIDMLEIIAYKDRLDETLQTLSAALATVPSDWIEAFEDTQGSGAMRLLAEEITASLQQHHTDEFWASLP